MNSTSCPPNLATDGAFLDSTSPCEVDMRVYWAIVALFLSFKILPSLWFTWSQVRRRVFLPQQSKHNSTKPTAHHPISLYFGWINSITLSLISFGIGFNLGNFNNGGSFALFSLTFLFMALEKCYQFFRMVRLGMRIVPRAFKGQSNRILTTSSFTKLHEFDLFGQFGLFIMAINVLISCICLIVLSPIYPTQDRLLGVIGFATKACFLLFYVFGMGWHLQRIKNAVMASQRNIQSIPEQERDLFQQRMRGIITFLTHTQIAAVGGGTCVFLPFLLLATEVVPWTWWVVMVFTGGVEVTTSFIALVVCRRNHRGGGGTSKSQGGKDTGGDDNNAPAPATPYRKSHTQTKTHSSAPASIVFMETLSQVKRKLRSYRKKGKKLLGPIVSAGDGDNDTYDEDGFRVNDNGDAETSHPPPHENISSTIGGSDMDRGYGPSSQNDGAMFASVGDDKGGDDDER